MRGLTDGALWVFLDDNVNGPFTSLHTIVIFIAGVSYAKGTIFFSRFEGVRRE
jgi:hypothetical protein